MMIMQKTVVGILVVLVIIGGVLLWQGRKPVSPANIDLGTVPADASGVKGRVTLGPACPVMREGDATCADKPYATTIEIDKTNSEMRSPFATVKSDQDGKFSIALGPGEYTLRPTSRTLFPSCKPQTVTVASSVMLEVNLICDTGIR